MIDVRSNFLAVRSLLSSKKRTEEIKYSVHKIVDAMKNMI